MSLWSKIEKLPHFIYLKLHEKRFKRITYVKKTRNSDVLLVGFSGFSKIGAPPGYNYVKTLSKIHANQIFILDNYGYNKAGSYYLGENGEWFMQDQIVELVQQFAQQKKIRKIITFGSSKGGTAALYYGIRLQADLAIIGAPQYYLGDYLNTDKHREIAEGILGSLETENIRFLNQLMKNVIYQGRGQKNPRIVIHYSPNEHTYSEHIKDMVSDLRCNEFEVQEDNHYTYLDHGNVGKYFAPLLIKMIQEEVVV